MCFLLVEKILEDQPGSYPTRSKETRFVVKIERIFGQVARSLLIATYHDFQLSHLVGRRQVLFNSSSTMC